MYTYFFLKFDCVKLGIFYLKSVKFLFLLSIDCSNGDPRLTVTYFLRQGQIL